MADVLQKCSDYNISKLAKMAGLYPFFRPIEGSVGSTVICNGKKLVMIGSNNYLGLTHDPRVIDASAEATRKFGTGCTGSRFLNGNLVLHDELEERLARFVGKPSALVFSTGFLTNLGAISSLAGNDELILSDSENHASIIAGCKISKSKVVPYEHNKKEDLTEKMRENANGSGAVIISDGVFSMTGAIADLPSLVQIKKDRPGTRIYIDDAHAIGVLGQDGRGTANHFGLTHEVDVIMGTFSKSLASIGGFIAAGEDVIEFVRHHARSLMFSAAIPASAAAAALKCLEIMEKEPEHVNRLRRNTTKMRKEMEAMKMNVVPSETPIISIHVGEEAKTFKLVQELFDRGIFACPVIFPAVPYGQSLLRTSYMSTHTDEDLDFVLDTLRELAPKYDLLKKDAATFQENAKDYNLNF